MTHFGIVTPPVPGHIHPFGALGRELVARGHRVTCFQVTDLEEKIQSEGLEFHRIGAREFPAGSLRASLDQLGRLAGFTALRFTIRAAAQTTAMECRELPDAVRAAGVEALLVDQMEPAGGAVAERLGLPFVTVCNALLINRDPIAPPAFSPWKYTDARWARLRNRVGYALSDRLTKPIADAVATARREWKLPALTSPDDSFSRLAQICQMPREFDFPRTALPPAFHYVGPLRGGLPRPIAFPWERLDGRPLVYASLGTLQNSRAPLFRTFAEACRGLGVQLVISHGGGLTTDEAAGLPGDALVVSYAPQVDLLARAALTMTHAGLNTVLDSMSNGVPVVAVPITYEQPAIARRVEWAGAGQTLALNRLTSGRLREAVQAVLNGHQYRAAAQKLAESSRAAGGTRRAADIVEQVVS